MPPTPPLHPHQHTGTVLEPTLEPIELSGAPVPLEDDAPAEPMEHEALVGDELSEKLADKLPTLACLGDTPFENDGENVELHKIVATEIVSDPVAAHEPEPIVSFNHIVIFIHYNVFAYSLLCESKRYGVPG